MKVNMSKAAGPDRVFWWVMNACANQLTEALTNIFSPPAVSMIVPKISVKFLKDYCPVAVTPIVWSNLRD